MQIKSLEEQDIFNGYSECLKEIGVFFISRVEVLRYVESQLKTGNKIFCAIENKSVVGTITINIYTQKELKKGYITNLGVVKKFRGYGVASNLIEHVYNYAKENSCVEISLNCESDMISFYEKFGFNISGTCMRRKINV